MMVESIIRTERSSITVKGDSAMKRNFFLYALGILLISMPCCSKNDSSTAPAKPAGIVATVGSASLTTEDLSRALNDMPPSQQFEYLSEDGKRVLIEMLIDWKLLSQEAVKAGLEKDEDVKAALKNTSRQSRRAGGGPGQRLSALPHQTTAARDR